MVFIKMINCNFEWLKGFDNFEKKYFGKIIYLDFFFLKYVKLSKWIVKVYVVFILLVFFLLNKCYNVKIMYLFVIFFFMKMSLKDFCDY